MWAKATTQEDARQLASSHEKVAVFACGIIAGFICTTDRMPAKRWHKSKTMRKHWQKNCAKPRKEHFARAADNKAVTGAW